MHTLVRSIDRNTTQSFDLNHTFDLYMKHVGTQVSSLVQYHTAPQMGPRCFVFKLGQLLLHTLDDGLSRAAGHMQGRVDIRCWCLLRDDVVIAQRLLRDDVPTVSGSLLDSRLDGYPQITMTGSQLHPNSLKMTVAVMEFCSERWWMQARWETRRLLRRAPMFCAEERPWTDD